MNPLQLLTNPAASGFNGHHKPVDPPGSAHQFPAGDDPSTTSDTAARRGPPVLFDDEKCQHYCTLLRHGLPRAKAARLLGIAPRTVQKSIKNDPDFALRVRQARLDCQSRAAAQVVRAGDSSWRAAAWVLEQEKRRRGPGKPRSALARLTDPRIRDELKKLVHGVLLEVMPELRQEITARRRSASPLAGAACDAVETYIANRQARLSAMAAEAKSLHQRGESFDLDVLWQKHLPDVPRPSTGSNAPQFPPADRRQPLQSDSAQNLTSISAGLDPRIDAHIP